MDCELDDGFVEERNWVVEPLTPQLDLETL